MKLLNPNLTANYFTGPCSIPHAQELSLRVLFEKVATFWPPRMRSKSCVEDELEDVPPETADASEGQEGASADGQPTGDVVDLQGSVHEEPLDDDFTNGSSTPPVRVMNDEYLAWTLGGNLRDTPSPGPPWEPETPKEKNELVEQLDGQDLSWIDDRLRFLENLDGTLVMLFLVPNLHTRSDQENNFDVSTF